MRAQLDGTAWAMQTAFLMLAGLLNSLLMLRSRFLSKATAWLGIVISAAGLGFFLPPAATSARGVIQRICESDKHKFQVSLA